MENREYLTKQLITYLGNKRALLDFIGKAVDIITPRLGKDSFTFADMFSGSGVVSRYMKPKASFILANDLESYCGTISRCYLANEPQELREEYKRLLEDMKAHPVDDGFIRRLYSPRDAENIAHGERVFYTPENAEYIDTCRQAIERTPPHLRPFFLAPLLSEASIKCNTSGVFKGFYKDGKTGIGAYGGSGRNALSRICAPISLPYPILSGIDRPFEVTETDANILAATMEPVDIAYIDPPYNQHPYGSNYFMLNLINDYEEPCDISRVSGIPKDWKRSAYNRQADAASALFGLCASVPARFLLISFNSEGYITPREMEENLSQIGKVEVFGTTYNTFKGSRNLLYRDIHVNEYLFLVDKG